MRSNSIVAQHAMNLKQAAPVVAAHELRAL
jgi:hypothetical protein